MKKKRPTHVTKAEYQATTAKRVERSLDEAFSVQWWGYRHINGGLHLKRFFSLSDLDKAFVSPFVDEVYGPFDATTRDEAELALHRLAEQSR